MQDIPCGLTPAELPAREQSHEQNSDFTTAINIFLGLSSKKTKFFWSQRFVASDLLTS
jgi:hypothetical protein